MNERELTTLWDRIRKFIGSFMEEWEELSVANENQPGMVMPDGLSTVVDDDGTIHAIAAMPTLAETDPTVPDWAKQPEKPTYTAQEVGALPVNTAIPFKVSQLTNDAGYITSLPVADSSEVGVVKPDGTTITIDSDGTIHGATTYELPTAGPSTLGGVIPDGETVTVDESGTLRVIGLGGPRWEVRTIDGERRLVIVIPEEE